MPFDGLVTNSICSQLNTLLAGGKIGKIFQPERDELIITVRAHGNNYKLLLCANPSFPRIHITKIQKQNPQSPPMFCMLLRKHLTNGIIQNFECVNFERIISINIDSIDELGDKTTKKLIIEIMGRHSNIILCNNNDIIIDSIRHIDSMMNRVREIMPARPYITPPPQEKTSILNLDMEIINQKLKEETDITVYKFLMSTIKGISPVFAREICYNSGINDSLSCKFITKKQSTQIINTILKFKQDIIENNYTPCQIIRKSDNKPIDYHCFNLSQYDNIRNFPSISQVIDNFYDKKDEYERLRQKSFDLLKLVNNHIERCSKKILIHEQTISKSEKMSKLQLNGELLLSNLFNVKKGDKEITVVNYYNNENVTIALDENKSPQENVNIFFKKYRKLKTGIEYANKELIKSKNELNYLESILCFLENCKSISDIQEVRDELYEQGYIHNQQKQKYKKNKLGRPLHFVSSDGFEIFVGKNNKQNDILTLKEAYPKDMWLHTKNIPGSHVIIKRNGIEIPDNTLIEAARLAAHYSKAKLSTKVEIDYTQVKNIKKLSGAKPGMVIYNDYFTVIVDPADNELIEKLIKE